MFLKYSSGRLVIFSREVELSKPSFQNKDNNGGRGKNSEYHDIAFETSNL